MKHNMITHKFGLRLSNLTKLAIATQLPFELSYKKAVISSKIRRKVLTPFKCLEFDKRFTATYNSHLLPSRSDNSRQK